MRKTTLLFALTALLTVAFAGNYFFNWYVPLIGGSSGNSTGGTNVTCGDNFFLCAYAGSQVTLTLNQTYTNTQYWAYAPIPWDNLSSVPAACPAGQAFTNLSGAGTCNAFLNETPYQSSAGGWANTSNATTTNYNATINGTLNVTGNVTAANFFGNINASYVQNLPPSSNGTVTSIATSSPITGGTITGSGTIGIQVANVSQNGYLSSTDWSTFNTKASSGSYGTCMYGISSVAGTNAGSWTGACASQQGTVTSVVASAPTLTGGTISTSGTIALNTTYTDARYLNMSTADARYLNMSNANAGTLADARIASATTWNGKAGTGNCTAGHFAQNTTTSGVQCLAAAGTGNCAAGQFAQNTTITGVQCLAAAGTGNCAAGQFAQNTTTAGVQCLAAGTVTSVVASAPTLTGGTISTSGTIALNTTYTDARYLNMSNANAGTLADAWIANSSIWNGKAGTGNCAAGQFAQNTTTSGVQCLAAPSAQFVSVASFLSTPVNIGIILNTTTTKPTCSAAIRGGMWFVQSSTGGVSDSLWICGKGASGNYAWGQIQITGW